MSKIVLLSQETIDKIAAGEVVERPSSVVKELVENAIDAGASAITVEIKEGGISLIRITDNGCGIPKEEVPLAFLRHSTSKIRSAEDLMCVHSLGFRGEALSSIAAVSRVEMITKPADALTGTRYVIEGSKEIADEEIGAPDGTTFLVRDLFYNTPARRKFLKTAQTEGTYISDMLEKLALSHPDISFKYINNNQTRLHTSGNGKKRDLIYHIYGREIAAALLEVNYKGEYFSLSGYIGKPVINRGNRNYENYFINGRYIKSSLLSRSIEEAYHNFLMQHQYPFTVLYFTFPEDTLDVNVHPTKMELRFGHNQEIYKELCDVLFGLLSHKELIPEVPVDEAEHKKKNLPPAYKEPIPEPFEKRRINEIRQQHHQPPIPEKPVSPVASPVPSKKTPAFEPYVPQHPDKTMVRESFDPFPKREETASPADIPKKQPVGEQMTLAAASPEFLTDDARKKHRIIGQLFQTYWLIEYEDKLYIMDQHAAHEKVYYERFVKRFREQTVESQYLSPPLIVSLNLQEEALLKANRKYFEDFGFEIEPFGGKEYCINAVPANLYGLTEEELFLEMLDNLASEKDKDPLGIFASRLATMACKAAVKGNHQMSDREANALIDELLTLENPYHCPHGRPTIISMTKTELEKKFKRIV